MKKTTKILLIILTCYAVFVLIVATLFVAIRNNPTDGIAMTYLRHEPSFEAEYGEVEHIGRNLTNRTVKTDKTQSVPYIVETKTQRILVFVELHKEQGQWEAVGWEVKEVHTIGD